LIENHQHHHRAHGRKT
jgi:hypothetical protein